MSDVSDYIKTHWADIHHSRNQDWKVLQLIGGLFVAFISAKFFLEKGEPTSNNINNVFLTILICFQIIASITGLLIATSHLIIFRSKLSKIIACEKMLDFPTKGIRFDFSFKYGIFGVQQMIMLLYFVIIAFLTTWLQSIWKPLHLASCLLPILIFLVGIVLCIVRHKGRTILEIIFTHRSKKSIPKNPFYANRKDLEDCLSDLSERPLKLIANRLISGENDWEKFEWHFQKGSNGITKDLLVNSKDTFQMSVANEKSKQDHHVHNSTLEIYISDYQMTLSYDSEKEAIIIKSGFLIIPPEIEHKVELQGFTYVLQIKQGNLTINNDKKIIP